ncbi:MAG: caspase family protein [Myxococcota bacterium]|nr:caspase family protein [Myxococcota bacterium]
MFDVLSRDSKTKGSKKGGGRGRKRKDHLEDPLTAKATVVGAAEDSEYAFDDSFTPALLSKMNDEGKSLDDALGELGDSPLLLNEDSADNDEGLHHPTIVSYGKERAAKGKRKAQKRAVLVANQKYKHISELSTPAAETASLAGTLKGQGYKAKVWNNRTAKSMKSQYDDMVSKAKEGDQLVAYFSGHGAEDGLVGIKYNFDENNDMMPYSEVSSVVSAATAKGANIRFIMDACHSGTGAQLVRSQQIGKLAEEGETMTGKVVSLALGALQDNRGELLKHTQDRTAAIDEAEQAIADHQELAPADDAPDAEWDAWEAKDDKLRAKVDKIAARFDRKAKTLWKRMFDGMAYVAQFTGLDEPPKAVADPRTMGAQLQAIDKMSNNLLKWGQDAEAEAREAAK